MKTGRTPLVLTTALSFFKAWNAESAYVLGVLYADGNVCNTPGKRSVSLELKDIEHVYLVAKAVDTAIPVVELERRDGRTSAKFYLSRVTIVEDCMAKGLLPAKTHTLQWPPDLPRDLESHFVRGYFDGDGTVTSSITTTTLGYKTKLRLLAFACGSDDFAHALQGVIHAQTGAVGRVRHAVKNCATLDYLRKADIQAVGEWMYAGAGLYLPRKREKWQEVFLSYHDELLESAPTGDA